MSVLFAFLFGAVVGAGALGAYKGKIVVHVEKQP